jgi:hypothetical protein
MALAKVFPYMLARQAGLPFLALTPLSHSWAAAEQALQSTERAIETQCQKLQNAFDAALTALPSSPLRTAVYNARKAFHQRQRLPGEALLSVWQNHPKTAGVAAAVEALRRAQNAQKEAEAAFAAEYDQAVQASHAHVQALAQTPDFQRALLFCSHDLLACLPKWTAQPTSNFSKKDRQTAFSVLQYLTRMATRTTPLSRLATVALPDPPEDLPLFIEKTAVTPDSALLPVLYDALLLEPAFYRSLAVRLNPCIGDAASEAYTWLLFDGEQERLQQTIPDETLRYVAQMLVESGRSCPFEALCKRLSEVSEQPLEQAEQYVLHLLDTGFLEWMLPVSGLLPNWCDGLYRYLAFLPSAPCVVATAELLQWLRTAARTLPYQPLEEAMQTQQQTAAHVADFCHRWGAAPPTLPAERIFYEDIAGPSVKPPELEGLLAELAHLWQCRPSPEAPPERQAFLAFARARLDEGHSAGHFLTLAEAFLRQTERSSEPTSEVQPPSPQHIGALFQVFEEDGQLCAVLNALYPGGGKLFARWLHLFPPALTEALQTWLNANTDQAAVVVFPWQGYSNANLQPPLTRHALAVPNGRTQPLPGGQTFWLGHLAIGFENNEIYLYDAPSRQRISLTDIGLEAPELRPPVMRLLWQTGVPYASRRALLPPERSAQTLETGVQHWPRYRQGRWVLDRARWRIEPNRWKTWTPAKASKSSEFRHLRACLRHLGIPRYFTIAWEQNEEPMFFDTDSPLSLQLLARKLHRHIGPLFVREYWPIPEQRTQEWAVEFSVETFSQ